MKIKTWNYLQPTDKHNIKRQGDLKPKDKKSMSVKRQINGFSERDLTFRDEERNSWFQFHFFSLASGLVSPFLYTRGGNICSVFMVELITYCKCHNTWSGCKKHLSSLTAMIVDVSGGDFLEGF